MDECGREEKRGSSCVNRRKRRKFERVLKLGPWARRECVCQILKWGVEGGEG